MLLLQHCDVIENKSIGNKAAIPVVETYKLLMNIDGWIAYVREKQFTIGACVTYWNGAPRFPHILYLEWFDETWVTLRIATKNKEA